MATAIASHRRAGPDDSRRPFRRKCANTGNRQVEGIERQWRLQHGAHLVHSCVVNMADEANRDVKALRCHPGEPGARRQRRTCGLQLSNEIERSRDYCL